MESHGGLCSTTSSIFAFIEKQDFWQKQFHPTNQPLRNDLRKKCCVCEFCGFFPVIKQKIHRRRKRAAAKAKAADVNPIKVEEEPQTHEVEETKAVNPDFGGELIEPFTKSYF